MCHHTDMAWDALRRKQPFGAQNTHRPAPHHDHAAKRLAFMISTFFLIDAVSSKTEKLDDAPELIERDGILFSLRGGPRTPQPTGDRVWDPVAVYAPDELTEEEFQALYEASRKRIDELNLKY
jgi:hypothetical protein